MRDHEDSLTASIPMLPGQSIGQLLPMNYEAVGIQPQRRAGAQMPPGLPRRRELRGRNMLHVRLHVVNGQAGRSGSGD
jgi:hypothetical protein